MYNFLKVSLIYCASLLVLVSCRSKKELVSSSTPEMNVIFILADDLGWSDTELYGNTSLYETPNIKRLAERGLTFTRAYAANPLCSPTRATIMTGQSSARNGITSAAGHLRKEVLEPSIQNNAPAAHKALEVKSATRLDTALPTLGKLIKKKGYTTGHFGKWHLGVEPFSPLEHGFDVDVPHHPGPGPAGSYVAPWKFANIQANYDGQHIEDRMASEAVSWMRMAVKSDQPFFMNYWSFSVHGPWDAKENLIEHYRPKIDTSQAQRSSTYAAMVHSLDEAVGTLLDELDRLGIADQTAIVFLGDNGGTNYVRLREYTQSREEYLAFPTDNAPLRGGKATMWEGGVRVPGIVVWPGLTTAGSRTDAIIQSTDFYPTILNLLGISIPEDHAVDGADITPVLRGEEWGRKPMFTYFPDPPRGVVADWLPPAMSVHKGKWKLIRLFHQGENQEHDYLLYNLKEDLGESENLANKYPEKVRELDALIEKHINETGAVVPLPNPEFNPDKYRPEMIGVPQRGHPIRASQNLQEVNCSVCANDSDISEQDK